MRKNLLLWALAALLAAGAGSCKKDDGGGQPKPDSPSYDYKLNLQITASGKPVKLNQLIAGPGGRYMLQQIMFYIGYPRLVKADNTEVPLADLLLARFDSGASVVNVTGNTFSFNVPEGSYTSMKFGVGVPPQIRDTVTHYHWGLTDPLNRSFGMIWDMTLNGYRNIAITGFVDTTKAQNKTPDAFFSYHIIELGTPPPMYKEIEISDAFTAQTGTVHNLNLNVDADMIFFNKSNPVDIINNRVTDMDNGPQITLGVAIRDNFCTAISVQ